MVFVIKVHVAFDCWYIAESCMLASYASLCNGSNDDIVRVAGNAHYVRISRRSTLDGNCKSYVD